MLLIELCGTPASGKNSTLEKLQAQYQSQTIEAYQYGQIDTGTIEVKILCSILETYLLVNQFFSTKTKENRDLIIFNRGLLDRIAWARFLGKKNAQYTHITTDIENVIWNSGLLAQIKGFFIFVTDYNKILQRRHVKYSAHPNKIYNIVNPTTISQLNKIYLQLYEELYEKFPVFLIDDLGENLTLDAKIEFVSNQVKRLIIENKPHNKAST